MSLLVTLVAVPVFAQENIPIQVKELPVMCGPLNGPNGLLEFSRFEEVVSYEDNKMYADKVIIFQEKETGHLWLVEKFDNGMVCVLTTVKSNKGI